MSETPLSFGVRVTASHVTRAQYVGEDDTPDGEPMHTPLTIPAYLLKEGTRTEDLRVLRRWPERVEGLVVGYTWRCEGQLSFPAFEGGEDFGPPYDGSYLSEIRRLKVYQIAVFPQQRGKRSWPAQVVEAVPEDVEEASWM